MARRLTRKQIKQDEFVSLVDQSMHWLGQNWRQAAIGLGGAIAAGLIYWGVSSFLASRQDAASTALAKALAAYSAPVGSVAPADAPVKFATDKERLAEAEKEFQRVVSKYWLTPQVRVARLYLARIAADRGDDAQAMRLLADITARRSADPVTRVAMADLIRMQLAKGEGPELVKQLEGMVAGKDDRLPRDVALFELARVYERTGKPDQAARLYRKLTEDFPDSPYTTEARQRMAAAS